MIGIPQVFSLDFYPMPRFWLESVDGSTLIQIQKNAFLFNWRKRDADYPHFDTVKAAFDKNKKGFFKFLADELSEAAPKPQLAELTYINIIEPCGYWSGPQDTAKVIPGFSLAIADSSGLEAPDFHQMTNQRLAADLTLSTTVRSARSVHDPIKPVLVIEYRATGLLPDPDALDKWFERAHDAIGDCFTAMTNVDIQTTYWQPVIRDA
jgi:uncharacterized protein (TIGR04255 family)